MQVKMANKMKYTVKEKTNSTVQGIMGIFAFVMMCVFPVVYHNYYFDILETKYQFYCVAAISMMVIIIGYCLCNGTLLELFVDTQIKKIINGLSVSDWAIILFCFANIMSWVLCTDYRWEAFWGTSGRYNGVFLIIIYTLVYFFVSRCFVFKKWYLDAFLLVGILVCIFGISDYFQMDLLGFKVNMMEEQKRSYVSTFGNINSYTAYVSLLVSASMILFIEEQNVKKMFFYYGTFIISMIALVMGTSDNAYLALGALLGLSPLYLFKTKQGFSRYWAALAGVFLSVISVKYINVIFADKVLGVWGVYNLISDFRYLPLIIVGLYLVSLLSGMLISGGKTEKKLRIISYTWCGFLFILVLLVMYAIYDANVNGNIERYEAVRKYIIINDDWGSGRGYIWSRAVYLFSNVFSFSQKLFGYGSDTYLLLMMQHYPPVDNIVIDSAHNEYLHFLITTGLVGMLSYIVFIGSSVIEMAKNAVGRPEVVAVMFAVIAYAAQATVNINLPIVMPIVLQLLAMGLSKAPKDAQ